MHKFTCFSCKKQFVGVNAVIKHLRKNCTKIRSRVEFQCGEVGCFRHFSNLKSLRFHLFKKHNSYENVDLLGDVDVSSHEPRLFESTEELPSLPSTSSRFSDDYVDKEIDTSCVRKTLSESIAMMYANPGIPRNLIQIFVDSYFKYISEKESLLRFKLQGIKAKGSGSIAGNVDKFLYDCMFLDRNMFDPFKTEYSRLKFFSDCGTYVEPVEIILGERLEVVRSQGKPSSSLIPCTFQMIPIASVFQKIFSMENVLSDTMMYIDSLKIKKDLGLYSNIMHGSSWQDIAFKYCGDRDLHLPIVLYDDDFDISNPLGTKAGSYKLGGVYLSIPCLPPKYSSTLNCIFTIALYHSSDRVTFGNHRLFQPIIQQLNSLKNEGIRITTANFNGTIRFHVVAITGDNLGLHSILGFVESFRANFPCRYCLVSKDDLNSLDFEQPSLARNTENYEDQLLIADPRQTGIKERCVWSRLDGFSLFENTAVDVLHDFLEGTCRYCLQFVITDLVTNCKYLSLELLQCTLQVFDYGPDSDSKPVSAVVPVRSSLTIKTSASEMINLVRYLGLMIGKYIPEESTTWALYLNLRVLLDKLLNNDLTEGNITQLKYLVAEHNSQYKEFAQTNLKPKHHFMTHYPTIIKKLGPLSQTWTMRFEAKHRIAKLAARSSTNRRNICKTIAIKNQLILNHLFISNSLCKKGFSSGASRNISQKVKENLLSFLSLVDQDFFSVVWVKVLGHCFRINDIITTAISDLCLPTYAKIRKIVFDSQKTVYFQAIVFDTICFDPHYHAFEVEERDLMALQWFPLETLVCPAPNTLTKIDSQMFITQRVPID